jgi:hypothetical protein
MWWQKIQSIAGVVRVAGAAWQILGWLGLTAWVVGTAIATIGAWRAVIAGIPLPIAAMAGFVTFAMACVLALVPAIYRALVASPGVSGRGAIKPNYAALEHVHSFTLAEAARLFVEEDPASGGELSPKAASWLPAMRSGVVQRDLELDASYYDHNEASIQRQYPGTATRVTRRSLVGFAKKHGQTPGFLEGEVA